MENPFIRLQMALGEDALDKLHRSHVAVFGIGGVGSYTAEALARAGIGAITLVDNDTVGVSNLNRQLCALESTVGLPKVSVMAARVRDIHPHIQVVERQEFVLPETIGAFDFGSYEFQLFYSRKP